MKIAVIGAGISGLGCAWLLSKAHDVHLFESENRLGGHAHTVKVLDAVAGPLPVDTGFLVYNELTYPHLTQFFKALHVETVDSEMSLSVQVDSKKLEWSGHNLNSVFAQRKNLLRTSFYKMLFEILRFGREADENLMLARRHGWSLADLLKAKKYTREFMTDYLIPIGAAIWSTPESKMLDFPAESFITFFINHKLLQVNDRPVWRTVKNGSVQYVKKAAAEISHVHVGKAVHSVERVQGKVIVRTDSETFEFDRAVMATHAPITAKILKMQSDLEKSVLSEIGYEPNRAVLHADVQLMPQLQRCWSAWNVFAKNNLAQEQKVTLTYYLNRLQPLATKKDYFVTLNPDRVVNELIQEFEYHHPQFNQAALRAQRDLPAIQGHGGVYFAGAWTRYGFHEDGLLSAVRVARLLGVEVPWGGS